MPIAEFEREVRTFLDAHAKPRPDVTLEWGVGSDTVGAFPELTLEEERAELDASRAWRRTLFEHDLGWITGPDEYGGRGLSADHERRFVEISSSYDLPDQVCFSLSLGMVAPTILRHGTATTRARYLRAIHRGDVLACQLFSEPGAGSDLASLSTRAVRHGDGWRLSGQKVWTSRAHLAEVGLCLARTGTPESRHRGLTCFLVDMHAPGVTVRPLRQMTGGATFNEVFLDDVHVDDDHRLGDVDAGWATAITTLMNERQRIGGGNGGVPEIDVPRLIALVRQRRLAADPVTRDAFARLLALDRATAWTAARGQAQARQGRDPGPEMSAAKLLRTATATALAEFVARVIGPAIVADTGEWGTYAWAQLVLGQPGVRIGGGTDEILRNVLAERTLGLPR